MSRERVVMTDLARLHAPLREELLAATARVIDSGRFVLGEEVDAFEAAFGHAVRADHAVACASGTDALVLALLAAGIGPGARVVCPAVSFFATASAVVRVGAQPVFADVAPDDFNLDPASAEELLDEFGPIDALVAVDLFGRAAPVARLARLARDHGIPFIEDAAQAVGALDEDGLPTGARADFGCFSLYPTKNLGALGDAGVVTTGTPERAERMRRLRAHGSADGWTHDDLGLNSRLDALQAALLSVKLPYLDKWSEARRAHAASYRDRLGAALGDSAPCGVHWPAEDRGSARHVFNQFVIRVDPAHRDALRAHLDADGIDSAVYYRLPLHRQPAFRGRVETPVPLDGAEAACAGGLALPIHPALRSDEIDRVVASIAAFSAGRPSR